jgi:hypothetical protein
MQSVVTVDRIASLWSPRVGTHSLVLGRPEAMGCTAIGVGGFISSTSLVAVSSLGCVCRQATVITKLFVPALSSVYDAAGCVDDDTPDETP